MDRITIKFDGKTIEVADTPANLQAYNELRGYSNNIDAFLFCQNTFGTDYSKAIEAQLWHGHRVFDQLQQV